MVAQRFDLPLDQTAASRFLPWVLAAAVYLAVVALAIAAVADGALRVFAMRTKLVTVTLPADDPAREAKQLEAALEILRATRGVTSATPVPPEELAELIEPWLGTAEAKVDLPLPRLIDVTLDPRAQPDLAALEQRLQEVAPGVSIGVEALSRDRAERMAVFFRAWASAAGIVLLLGALAVVGLIVRSSLVSMTQVVELLRAMGAPDRYLARQVERYALLSGLRGGVIGFLLAAVTIAVLLYSSRRMELAGSVELGLRPLDWLLLACVPVVSALLVTAIARTTALHRLTRSA